MVGLDVSQDGRALIGVGLDAQVCVWGGGALGCYGIAAVPPPAEWQLAVPRMSARWCGGRGSH